MKKGFTLIEVLLVIGIIAVLAAGIIIALNPGRQFARTRDTQRVTHLNDILKAIFQNITENSGKFVCQSADANNNGDALDDIPTASPLVIATSGYNIAPCLVPTYMTRLPVDPSTGVWNSTSSYNTNYTIQRDAATGRIILRANGELNPNIEVSQ